MSLSGRPFPQNGPGPGRRAFSAPAAAKRLLALSAPSSTSPANSSQTPSATGAPVSAAAKPAG